jgi:integrase
LQHTKLIEDLSDSIDAYLEELQRLERATSTVRQDRRLLRQFNHAAGKKLKTHQVKRSHVDGWLEQQSHVAPNTRKFYLGRVKTFLAWCVDTNRLRENPAKRLEVTARQTERPKTRIDSEQFPALLDAAGDVHPRNRAAVAVTLYTLLRAVDVVNLRVGECDREEGNISAYLEKTNQQHEIGISLDLDEELERWFTWYKKDLGVMRLEPWWPVIPPLFAGQRGLPVSEQTLHIRQLRKNGEVALLRPQTLTQYIVQPALRAIGVPLRFVSRDGSDVAANEGAHTLRRSGARALYDRLVSGGSDQTDALFLVQALLHHANVQMTAGYIGVALQRDAINKIIRGARMYGGGNERGGNVVPLRARAR